MWSGILCVLSDKSSVKIDNHVFYKYLKWEISKTLRKKSACSWQLTEAFQILHGITYMQDTPGRCFMSWCEERV